MGIKTVLFDLDGTITDPGIGITNSIMYALRKLGENVPPREELYKFIGPPLVPAFMEHYGYSEEKARLGLKYYREYFSESGIYENVRYDGIIEMLDMLKNKNIRIVLATSKPDVYAEKILEKFGVRDYFSFIAANTLDEKRDTKEAVIDYAVESLGLERAETVMVGDRKFDVSAAVSRGLVSVGVTYGYGSEEELKNAGADFIAGSADELKAILGGLI